MSDASSDPSVAPISLQTDPRSTSDVSINVWDGSRNVSDVSDETSNSSMNHHDASEDVSADVSSGSDNTVDDPADVPDDPGDALLAPADDAVNILSLNDATAKTLADLNNVFEEFCDILATPVEQNKAPNVFIKSFNNSGTISNASTKASQDPRKIPEELKTANC